MNTTQHDTTPERSTPELFTSTDDQLDRPDRTIERTVQACRDATTVHELTAAWNTLLNSADTTLTVQRLRDLTRTQVQATPTPDRLTDLLAGAPAGHPVTTSMAATAVQAALAGTRPRMDPVTELCTLTLVLAATRQA